MLLSLISYIQFRNAKTIFGGVLSLFCAGFAAICSVLSKEGGATLLLLYPLIEWFCYRDQAARFRVFSKVISALLGVLFVGLFIAVVVIEYENYDGRFYSLTQRLQIQGWVLLEYLRYILLPVNTGMSLFHDDVEWNFQFKGLGFVGFYWLWHIALCGAVTWLFRSHRLIVFCVLWFYLSHIIESTILPLELMFEHRNYLASIACLLAVAYLMDLGGQKLKSKGLPLLAVVLVVAPLAYLSLQLAHRSALWSDIRILTHKWAQEHPGSLRSQYHQIVLREQFGFPEQALSEVLLQEQVFDDVILPMYRIRLECELDALVDNENKLDVASFNSINYTSGVAPALSKLIEFSDRVCIDRQLTNGGLGDLVAAVELMPLLKGKPSYYAQYLDIADDYNVSQLQYSRAIFQRERLWTIQATIPAAIKLSELFVLGGNLVLARKYLEWSEAENDKRWFDDDLANRNILRLQLLIENAERFELSTKNSSN
jgi:hypothetical protein